MDIKEGLQLILGLLFISVVVGVLVSWILSIYASLKLHESAKVGKSNQESCGEFYLEGESARNLIYTTYTDNIKSLQENTLTYMLILVILLVGVMMIIMIYLTVYNFKNRGWLLLAFVSLLYVGLFIFSVISRSGLNNKISFMIGDVIEKNKLLGSQIGYLISILVLLAISWLLYKYSINEEEVFIKTEHFMFIIGCMAILTIFIPVITADIFKFKTDINDYYYNKVVGDDTNTLNTKIKDTYLSNPLLENHLRINIQRLKRTKELPVIDEEYKKELYKYVMHGMNMAELRNIVIPEELLVNINSKYLKGENIIVLKNDLLGYYNGGKVSTVSKYFKDNNNKYINNIKDDTALEALLNVYVRNNDTYKINNNIPSDIRKIMQELRQNTQMEETVDAYYRKIGTITIILFILGFYLIFHRIYDESDIFRQVVSLIMIILMIIVGFFGWFFKELWL